MRNRIKEIAKLVPDNSIIADIGCDHAYLIIELFKLNKITFAYAIDNKDGPIKNAKSNIEKYDLLDKVKIIKTNGLNFVFDKKLNTLVFAGLGGLNVIEILNDNIKKIKNIEYIITDVHRDNDKLTIYLNQCGFLVDKSMNIIDNKKSYILIRYKNENF